MAGGFIFLLIGLAVKKKKSLGYLIKKQQFFQ